MGGGVANAVNWVHIRTEYETTNISQRKLAEKHGVSYPTLRDRCKREEWAKSKDKTRSKIVATTLQKTVTKIATKEADRNARVMSLADKLANKLEQAIEQVEQYIVTNKTKTKTVEYNYDFGKPSKEVTTENEDKAIIDGIIDKQGLKFLTGALKDINDIQVVTAEKLALERRKVDAVEKKLVIPLKPLPSIMTRLKH